jgi:hypothetical protein
VIDDAGLETVHPRLPPTTVDAGAPTAGPAAGRGRLCRGNTTVEKADILQFLRRDLEHHR